MHLDVAAHDEREAEERVRESIRRKFAKSPESVVEHVNAVPHSCPKPPETASWSDPAKSSQSAARESTSGIASRSSSDRVLAGAAF
jgi:hypothetical protein